MDEPVEEGGGWLLSVREDRQPSCSGAAVEQSAVSAPLGFSSVTKHSITLTDRISFALMWKKKNVMKR
ncbi:unnamed protein product [Arctogadus glacialis]